jgi:hypothetical protein
MNNLKEINFETIGLKDLEKICEKEPLTELRERAMMVDKAVRNMEMPALATPTERVKLREDMLSKANLMHSIITIKEREETQEQQKLGSQYVEKTLAEQLPNLRYSSEDAIRRMENMGVIGVPLDVPQWQKLTSTTIEAKCQSGKTRKLDLKKLAPQTLRRLTEKPFVPMFFVLESEGMVDAHREPVKLWSNQSEYQTVMSQRQVSRTVLALMWVG